MSEEKTKVQAEKETYWKCWVCDKKFTSEVSVCDRCESSEINMVVLPSKAALFCATPPESDADPSQSLRSKETKKDVSTLGIVQDVSYLTETEIANNYIGLIRSSWADAMLSEGGGRFAQKCCYAGCGEVRQANNFDLVVGPCEFCHKRLLVVPDAEFVKRLTVE